MNKPGSRLGLVTFLVRDYDEAISWFCEKLAFDLVEDAQLKSEKRWVAVAPKGGGCGLLLARADGPQQITRIGGQTGDRVAFFLETDDFSRDHEAMRSKGVTFLERPRHETYGTVAKFIDLYGNGWDLIERRS